VHVQSRPIFGRMMFLARAADYRTLRVVGQDSSPALFAVMTRSRALAVRWKCGIIRTDAPLFLSLKDKVERRLLQMI
jgi:hypothetical protein